MLLYLLYRDNLYVTEVVQRQFFLRGRLCFSLVSFILGIAGIGDIAILGDVDFDALVDVDVDV